MSHMCVLCIGKLNKCSSEKKEIHGHPTSGVFRTQPMLSNFEKRGSGMFVSRIHTLAGSGYGEGEEESNVRLLAWFFPQPISSGPLQKVMSPFMIGVKGFEIL